MGIGASRTKQIVDTIIENKMKTEINNDIKNIIDVTNETVNQEIQNVIISTQTNAHADSSCMQNISITDLETGDEGVIDIKPIHQYAKATVSSDVIQKALSDVKIEAKMKSELKEKIANNSELTNKIEQTLKQLLDQVSQMPAATNPVSVLAPGIALTDSEQKISTDIHNIVETTIKNMIENKTTIKNIIKNIIERNIKTDNIVNCKTAANAIEYINLQRLKAGKKGKINVSDINQTCVIDLISNCMNVSETGQEFVNDIANKIGTEIEQKSTTTNDAKNKTDSETKNSATIKESGILIAIISGIVMLALISGIVYYFKNKDKK